MRQLLILLCFVVSLPSHAALRVLELVLEQHLFTPSVLVIPAGEKVKILIHNRDPQPEEFESFELNREKVILAQSTGVVFIGPVEPGEYSFIGEYHPDTARGIIKVVPPAEFARLQQEPTHAD